MTLALVETVVRERLGLDPAALGPNVLPSALERRMIARDSATPAAYLRLLAADVKEAEALAAELVVPETWFFRGGRALFDRLAEFIASRTSGGDAARPVRVLSVPCSSGEEPYSLVIALHEHLVPPELYRIDAVDLSPAHLARAQVGRYASFAFREVGPDIRPAFFREHDGRWTLLPHLISAVEFRIGNATDPTFLLGELPFDLILCRNLFIYLTPDGRRRAMATLDRLLAADGWLCLTPGEADRLPPGSFAPVLPIEFGIYRRASAGSALFAALELQRAAPPRTTIEPTHLPEPIAVLELPVQAPPVFAPASLELARTLADSGRLGDARDACETLLREGAGSPEVYTLLGVIHQAEGHTAAAAEAFRKALYLAPGHREALSHMIVLCDRRGDVAQAVALRKRLARAGGGDGT